MSIFELNERTPKLRLNILFGFLIVFCVYASRHEILLMFVFSDPTVMRCKLIPWLEEQSVYIFKPTVVTDCQSRHPMNYVIKLDYVWQKMKMTVAWHLKLPGLDCHLRLLLAWLQFFFFLILCSWHNTLTHQRLETMSL